jgi:transposase
MSEPSSLTPEQRIKELEQQLADTKQRAEFFEAVVEVDSTSYTLTVLN